MGTVYVYFKGRSTGSQNSETLCKEQRMAATFSRQRTTIRQTEGCLGVKRALFYLCSKVQSQRGGIKLAGLAEDGVHDIEKATSEPVWSQQGLRAHLSPPVTTLRRPPDCQPRRLLSRLSQGPGSRRRVHGLMMLGRASVAPAEPPGAV